VYYFMDIGVPVRASFLLECYRSWLRKCVLPDLFLEFERKFREQREGVRRAGGAGELADV